ncbi:MAG: complex I NDUFA9 subunit family protein [Alphaproteobacteria bacterium]
MAAELITVFGGSGFIGRQVVQRLAARGAQVRVAVRRPDSALFLKPMGDVGQVTPVQANIRNADSVRAAVAGATGVVNLVGVLAPSGRQNFETIHAQGAALIADAARTAGAKRVVHVSALGAAAESPSAYARSKAAGEATMRKAFPDATVLRPSVVFGPQDGFFSRFAAMAQFMPALPVLGTAPDLIDGRIEWLGEGGPKFQPVYVGDVADAVLCGLYDPATAGKTYELGGPTVYSFKLIMEMVLRYTGRRRLLVPVPFWAASLLGTILGVLPGAPLTRDQVKLLRRDNVISGKLPALPDLGIHPRAAEVVLPTYLDMYRRGGRYTRGAPA